MTTTPEFDFADPPARRRRWAEAVAIARRHPGKWLRFPADKGSNSTNIEKAHEDIEATKRTIDGQTYIYLRAERPLR